MFHILLNKMIQKENIETDKKIKNDKKIKKKIENIKSKIPRNKSFDEFIKCQWPWTL